uniref:Uncharacterized protein n=1 Tax=viral metagenome TaxID=1070528 RepID=A0A6H1ZI09_9ZZZZ
MQHLILIDKEAVTAPTSKMIKRDEYMKIRPNDMPRQVAFIFKPNKPIAIERDLAVFLMEKYKGMLILQETIYYEEKTKKKVAPEPVKKVEEKPVVEVKKVPEVPFTTVYDDKKHFELVQIAKERKIKSFGIKRPELIRKLIESDLKEN